MEMTKSALLAQPATASRMCEQTTSSAGRTTTMRMARCCILLILAFIDGTTVRAQDSAAVSAQNQPVVVSGAQQLADLQSADNILRAEHLKLTAEVVNLRAEINNHRAQENFYGNALDEQANRFALIVGGLLALGAFVSWAEFRREVSAVRKSVARAMEAQEQKRGVMEERMRNGEIRALRIQANLLRLFARHNANLERYSAAFVHYVLAAATVLDSKEFDPSPTRLALVLEDLASASNFLARLRWERGSDELTQGQLDVLRPEFRKLLASQDEAVSAASLKLHAEMLALLPYGEGEESDDEASSIEKL